MVPFSDLPEVDADTIRDPLNSALRNLRSRLDSRIAAYQSDLSGYWGTVRASILASQQTMQASLFLVSDKRLADKERGSGPGPLPAQAVMLQRGLLEVLANLMALAEEPRQRDRLFRFDGYCQHLLRIRHLQTKHKDQAPWSEAFKRNTAYLDLIARSLKLSPKEASNPTVSWPRLHNMLTGRDPYGRPWFTGTRHKVIDALYHDSYGPSSRMVHQKDLALYWAMIQSQDMTDERLGELRNIPVLRALTFHAAVLSEIEAVLPWSASTAQEDRQKAWLILIEGFDPAAEIHTVRYRELLLAH